MVLVFVDLHFFVCFYYYYGREINNEEDARLCLPRVSIVRCVLNCIPAWIRFAQCIRRFNDTMDWFPHLLNAGKYSSTFFVVIFAALRDYHSRKYNNFLSAQRQNVFFHRFLGNFEPLKIRFKAYIMAFINCLHCRVDCK